MVTAHNLGFPRIGARRELKFALETYWAGTGIARGLAGRGRHPAPAQLGGAVAAWTWVPVGDFAFYDQVLDMSFTLGNLPERVRGFHGDALDNYFRVARGRSAQAAGEHGACCGGVAAGEMTKWFDTNYHYIVPEFSAGTEVQAGRLAAARAAGRGAPAGHQRRRCSWARDLSAWARARTMPTGSRCCRACCRSTANCWRLWPRRAPTGCRSTSRCWCRNSTHDWQQAFAWPTGSGHAPACKLLLTTYFGDLGENLQLAGNLPVAGMHLDPGAGRDESTAC